MNTLDGIFVVGLTGQTGSGKTTVSEEISKSGLAVINCDRIARRVTAKDTDCVRDIAKLFPSCVKNGELDRAQTAKVVFLDSQRLSTYTAVIFPYITTEILKELRRIKQTGAKVAVLDAPTLFESRANDFCDMVISVLADEQVRRERIIARDKLDLEAAEKRLSAQKPNEWFEDKSDIVLYNNGNISELKLKTETAVKTVLERANG